MDLKSLSNGTHHWQPNYQPPDYKSLIGKVVICKTDGLKHFVRNSYYEIAGIQERKYYEPKIRLKGITGFYDHSSFEEVSAAVLRDMRINDIFDDSATQEIVTVTKPTGRKIDTVSNKEEAMFRLMVKEIKGYYESSWKLIPFDKLAKKISEKDTYFGLKIEDFESLRNMTIEQLLNSNINK